MFFTEYIKLMIHLTYISQLAWLFVIFESIRLYLKVCYFDPSYLNRKLGFEQPLHNHTSNIWTYSFCSVKILVLSIFGMIDVLSREIASEWPHAKQETIYSICKSHTNKTRQPLQELYFLYGMIHPIWNTKLPCDTTMYTPGRWSSFDTGIKVKPCK